MFQGVPFGHAAPLDQDDNHADPCTSAGSTSRSLEACLPPLSDCLHIACVERTRFVFASVARRIVDRPDPRGVPKCSLPTSPVQAMRQGNGTNW